MSYLTIREQIASPDDQRYFDWIWTKAKDVPTLLRRIRTLENTLCIIQDDIANVQEGPEDLPKITFREKVS